jgi:hypothetical protein
LPTYQFSTPDGHTWEADADHDLSDDEIMGLSEHVKTAAPEPMKPGPSLFSRAIALPARGVDYALGAAGEAIGSVLQSGPARAYASMFEGVPGAATPADIDAAKQKMTDLREGKTTPGTIIADAIPRPEGGVLGHVAAGSRAVVGMAADMGRDPAALGALGALRKLGLAGKALTAGASAMFAIEAGKAVTPELLQAQKLYDEDKGWSPRVTESVAKAVLLGGAATMGALHTPHALGEVVKATLPDRGGDVYRADPNATPDQVAALDATEATRAARGEEVAGGRVAALDRAVATLRAEESARARPQPAPRTAAAMGIDASQSRPAAFPLPSALPEPGAPVGADVGPTPARPGSQDAAGYQLMREVEEARAAAEPAVARQPVAEAPPSAASQAGVPPEIASWLDRAQSSTPTESAQPGAARAYALEGQPTAELMKMHAMLSERLQRGLMTDPEASAYLQIDKALKDPARLARQTAEAQVRAMAAVDPAARAATGTSTPEDVAGTASEPRLSVGESTTLADVAARSLAPETAPRLGAKVPGVRFSPAAAEVAAERGAEPAPIPDARTPEGYRKLAAQRDGGAQETLWTGGPGVARALKARLMELWRNEKGDTGKAKDTVGPAQEQIVAPWYEKLGRQFVRTMEPAFQATERLPVVGKELAGRQRAYVTDWEKLKGVADADSVRALQSVGLDVRNPKAMEANPLSGQIQAFIDGRASLESVPEAARPAAQRLLEIGQGLAKAKVEAGVIAPEDVLEHHWPRQTNVPESFTMMEKARQYARDNGGTVEDALSKLQQGGSQIMGTRATRTVGSSQARATGAAELTPDQYRTDWGAWFDDIRETTREVSEARHLGKNGQIALDLANKLNAIPADRNFALTLLDRLRGAEPQSGASRLSSNIRATQAGVGLITSPITQFGTLMNTAAETSVPATVKAIADTFTKPVLGPDKMPMRWTQPIRRLRAAMNEARLGAASRGSLNAEVAGSLADFYTKTNTAAGQKGTGYAGKVGRLWHVRGTSWTDGLMRVIADATAPHIVPDAWDAAKSGNKLAQRQLDNWHVDWRKDALTPDMVDTAARRISERSQFKVGIGDVPLWASSPWGKVAFQFQSFGYAHTQFVGQALDEARRGNVLPIAKLLTLGAGMGYLTNEAKHAIFQGKDPKKYDEVTLGQAAADAFGQGSHYSTEGARGKALAYIEGIGAAGGAGALSGAYERLASGDPSKILLGASGSDAEALARAGQELLTGNPGKAAGRFVQGMLPVGPLGLNPRELAGEALADKPVSNPGYGGRLLDYVREHPGALARGGTGELGPGDAGTSRQARADQGQLERESKLQKLATDETGTMITKPPEKPMDEKLKAARKATVMAQLQNELVKAIKLGATQDQLNAIKDKYMAMANEGERPVRMGWKASDKLGRRVILDEEEAAQ